MRRPTPKSGSNLAINQPQKKKLPKLLTFEQFAESEGKTHARLLRSNGATGVDDIVGWTKAMAKQCGARVTWRLVKIEPGKGQGPRFKCTMQWQPVTDRESTHEWETLWQFGNQIDAARAAAFKSCLLQPAAQTVRRLASQSLCDIRRPRAGVGYESDGL